MFLLMSVANVWKLVIISARVCIVGALHKVLKLGQVIAYICSSFSVLFQGLFQFHLSFTISLLIFAKRTLAFNTICIESADRFGEYYHLKNSGCSKYKHKVLSHLLRSSLFPFSNVFYFSFLVKFVPKYLLFGPITSGIILFPFILFILSAQKIQQIDHVFCNCGELIYSNSCFKKILQDF